MARKEELELDRNSAGAAPWLRALRVLSLTMRLGISLFLGAMIAVAGGALYPPLTHIAAPLICSGKLETVSHIRTSRGSMASPANSFASAMTGRGNR